MTFYLIKGDLSWVILTSSGDSYKRARLSLAGREIPLAGLDGSRLPCERTCKRAVWQGTVTGI